MDGRGWVGTTRGPLTDWSWGPSTPALFTRPLSVPGSFSAAVSKSLVTSAGLDTSALIATAEPPVRVIASTTAAAASALDVKLTATAQPSSASWIAHSLPIPRLAPVTTQYLVGPEDTVDIISCAPETGLVLVSVYSQMLSAAALLLSFACRSTAANIYVSTTGSDAGGDGSPARPFGSLPRAKAAARALLAGHGPLTSDLTIQIGAGHYYLPHGLSFGPEDSGRDGFNVVWEGSGAGTQLHGGVPIASGWVPDSTGAAGAGAAVPAGSIWRTNVTAALSAANVTATRFFLLIRPDGFPATLARLPEAGSGYLPELGCATGKGLTFTCPAGVLPDALASQVADAGIYVRCSIPRGL